MNIDIFSKKSVIGSWPDVRPKYQGIFENYRPGKTFFSGKNQQFRLVQKGEVKGSKSSKKNQKIKNFKNALIFFLGDIFKNSKSAETPILPRVEKRPFQLLARPHGKKIGTMGPPWQTATHGSGEIPGKASGVFFPMISKDSILGGRKKSTTRGRHRTGKSTTLWPKICDFL